MQVVLRELWRQPAEIALGRALLGPIDGRRRNGYTRQKLRPRRHPSGPRLRVLERVLRQGRSVFVMSRQRVRHKVGQFWNYGNKIILGNKQGSVVGVATLSAYLLSSCVTLSNPIENVFTADVLDAVISAVTIEIDPAR